MTDLDQVGTKLRASIKSAQKSGYKIAPSVMRGRIGGEACCCALGSMVIDLPTDRMFTWSTACERLGITMNQALSLAIGFDMRRFTAQDLPDVYELSFFNLGRKLRLEIMDGSL